MDIDLKKYKFRDLQMKYLMKYSKFILTIFLFCFFCRTLFANIDLSTQKNLDDFAEHLCATDSPGIYYFIKDIKHNDLINAASNGNIDAIKIASEKNLVNAQDDNGFTVLDHALAHGHNDIIRELFSVKNFQLAILMFAFVNINQCLKPIDCILRINSHTKKSFIDIDDFYKDKSSEKTDLEMFPSDTPPALTYNNKNSILNDQEDLPNKKDLIFTDHKKSGFINMTNVPDNMEDLLELNYEHGSLTVKNILPDKGKNLYIGIFAPPAIKPKPLSSCSPIFNTCWGVKNETFTDWIIWKLEHGESKSFDLKNLLGYGHNIHPYNYGDKKKACSVNFTFSYIAGFDEEEKIASELYIPHTPDTLHHPHNIIEKKVKCYLTLMVGGGSFLAIMPVTYYIFLLLTSTTPTARPHTP